MQYMLQGVRTRTAATEGRLAASDVLSSRHRVKMSLNMSVWFAMYHTTGRLTCEFQNRQVQRDQRKKYHETLAHMGDVCAQARVLDKAPVPGAAQPVRGSGLAVPGVH
jgi:hypothetical protein